MASSGSYLASEVWIEGVLVFRDEGYHVHHRSYGEYSHGFQRDLGGHTATISLNFGGHEGEVYALFIRPLGGGRADISHGRAYEKGAEAWKDVLRWIFQGLSR